MKVDSNMETDRLLQRYARSRRDASMPGAKADDGFRETNAQDNQDGTSHLDADELIAYAENALPGATRTRYTSHLSDCDSCRKLVTDLVLSSGVAAELETQAVPQAQGHARSWSDWLAVIFAPRVLRYAASVIMLIGIAAIGIVVFRGGMDSRFNNRKSPAEDSSVNKNGDGSANRNNESDLERKANVEKSARPDGEISKPDTVSGAPSPTTTDALREVPVEVQKAGQDKPPANPPAPASVTDDGVFGEQRATRDKDSELAQRRQPPSGAAAVDKSKPKKETESATSTGKLARESASRAEADETVNTEGAKVATSRAPAAREEKSAANNRARNNTEAAPRDPDERKSRTDGGRGEGTRVVGGKQFVRRDGAWVDIAYRSQATTNVRRGSDQYRALVADEPGLRTIANQLGGEVVVIWKGRAYRIH